MNEFQKKLNEKNHRKAVERKKEEDMFRKQHRFSSDEQLMQYLMSECKRLGKKPKWMEVTGCQYIKTRFKDTWGNISREAIRRLEETGWKPSTDSSEQDANETAKP